MEHTQFDLLRRRRFLPLFVTQFLGALNDNLFKNALVILIAYRLAEDRGLNGQVLVTVAAGIFILPFFLFSATAGQLADKIEKARLIRLVKVAEVVIMAMAVVGFGLGDPWFLLAVLFLMGAHSAFFGPLKYAILPDHLAATEIIGGNAIIEGGTFLAILFGTIAGGLLILAPHGTELVGGCVVGLAVAGWLASRFIPPAPPPAPDLRVTVNFPAETWSIIRFAAQRRDVFGAVLGISWFWLVGATFLSQFPTFAKDVLAADQGVVTLFLTVFSVGIGLGSVWCGRLLHGEITARHVPLAALGLSLFAADLSLAGGAGVAGGAGGALADVGVFLSHPANWRILLDLLLTAVCGGLYIVPLYAILQSRGEPSHRARTIAANNVMNALFMAAAALATSLMLAQGRAVTEVFLTVAVANLAVAAFLAPRIPDAWLKWLATRLFRAAYRVEVRGLAHYGQAGPRAVVVANHVSFLDGALLAAFLPGRPAFAVDTQVARAWWARPGLRLVDVLTLDPSSPMATKSLIRVTREGRRCIIFPEGRITTTGALMKVHDGSAMVADKADADVIPIRIDGAEFTPFSRLKGKVRRRWFPKIVITIRPPRRLSVDPALKGRTRRRAAGDALYDVMAETMFETGDRRRTLFAALLEARLRHGAGRIAAEDTDRRPLEYGRLVRGAVALGRRAEGTEPVGVLLPNSVAVAVTFFALQAIGRVPAMLNFSSGAAGMRAAQEISGLRAIVTSRRFVATAGLEQAMAGLGERSTILYLEDLRDDIRLADKLHALVSRKPPRRDPDDAALVLFTSGSEGRPKGVVLSHANILANCYQLAARLDFNPSDIAFNAMPVFHAFGLTGGLLLPLLSGVKAFLYPSPLHYRLVPALVYETNATILFGTDTFLTGYARRAHPFDFRTVRYVFSGAEAVRPETQRTWMEKFGLRILEGYGATETAPVLAINTPMHCRMGTVGRLLPGIRHRLDAVPGLERGRRLVVGGPNVMKGYLTQPGEVVPPRDGWYDTGDLVDIDADGFVTILGRLKRFAKVGGEMVSLGAVEHAAEMAWPERRHAVVAVPDPRRGERLVLVTEFREATRAAFIDHARRLGLSELAIPATVMPVDHIPCLATGKTDYPAVLRMVEAGGTGPTGAIMPSA